jgi:hypothetical protein
MRKVLTALSMLAVSAAPAWAGVNPPRVVTPEPASVALMGAGLAALGFVAWRRGKRNK